MTDQEIRDAERVLAQAKQLQKEEEQKKMFESATTPSSFSRRNAC